MWARIDVAGGDQEEIALQRELELPRRTLRLAPELLWNR